MTQTASIMLIRDLLDHIELCCDGWSDSDTHQIHEFYYLALNRDVNELNRLVEGLQKQTNSQNAQKLICEAV